MAAGFLLSEIVVKASLWLLGGAVCWVLRMVIAEEENLDSNWVIAAIAIMIMHFCCGMVLGRSLGCCVHMYCLVGLAFSSLYCCDWGFGLLIGLGWRSLAPCPHLLPG